MITAPTDAQLRKLLAHRIEDDKFSLGIARKNLAKATTEDRKQYYTKQEAALLASIAELTERINKGV